MKAVRRRLVLIPLLGCLMAGAVAASEVGDRESLNDSSELQPIVVDALRTSELSPTVIQSIIEPRRIRGDRLYLGAAAFQARHALAPDAALRFSISDSRPSLPLVLKLEAREAQIPIELDENGTFTLPTLGGKESTAGEIVANRETGELVINSLVRSTPLSAEERRLGDLRLECWVRWEIGKDELPLYIRAPIGLIGPCDSPRIQILFPVSRKIASAIVQQGDRSKSVPIAPDGMGYWPPMHDNSWGDEAALKLTFAENSLQDAELVASPK